MRSKIKYSVIVPVYNVESYVEYCLKSLINNNLDNYEVIIVNDGSTDNSLSLCEEIASNCDKIKIISQKNGGLSSARNSGLNIAEGDYILFVDSDDWVDSNYLHVINNALSLSGSSDIIVFGYESVVNESNKRDIVKLESRLYLKNEIGEAVAYLDNNGISFNLAWNKVYKRWLFEKISFNPSISYCEDLVFNSSVFNMVDKVYVSNDGYYKYRITLDSLTNNHFYNNYREMADIAVLTRSELYRNLKITRKYQHILYNKELNYRLGEITNMYRPSSVFNIKERLSIIKDIKGKIASLKIGQVRMSNIEKLIFIIINYLPAWVSDRLLVALFYLKNNMRSSYNFIRNFI